VQTFVQQRFDDSLRSVYAWMLGRLSTDGWSDLVTILPYVVVAAVVILLHRRALDVMALGDVEAAALGVDPARTRLVLVLASTLGTAAVVSVSGLIGFVGIVVPHAVRLLFGASHRSLLPLALAFGAAFLVVADVMARSLMAPAELPIGVVTAFVGAPLLRARPRAEEPPVSSIECRDLTVRRGGRAVVREVSLTVAPGSWAALVGPNGAGKTSLLHALCGLLPSEGELEVAGIDPRRASRRDVARSVALLPQQPVVPEGVTVRQLVALGRMPYLRLMRSETLEDRRAVERALLRLDLLPLADRAATTLSGGELQRVVLARALAQEATVLVLDEPTSALDIGHQQSVLELVDELRRSDGRTVIAAMHDLTVAAQYASQMILLHQGEKVADDVPEQVLEPGLLRSVYAATVQVLPLGDGPAVVPLRRRPA